MAVNEKARRVTQKVQWLRRFLEEKGCDRCGFTSDAIALAFTGTGRTNAMKLAYDDYGWQKIKRAAAAARIICLNCKAIEEYEQRLARLGG